MDWLALIPPEATVLTPEQLAVTQYSRLLADGKPFYLRDSLVATVYQAWHERDRARAEMDRLREDLQDVVTDRDLLSDLYDERDRLMILADQLVRQVQEFLSDSPGGMRLVEVLTAYQVERDKVALHTTRDRDARVRELEAEVAELRKLDNLGKFLNTPSEPAELEQALADAEDECERLKVRVALLEEAIRETLADESCSDGWGPDRTVVCYLESALKGEKDSILAANQELRARREADFNGPEEDPYAGIQCDWRRLARNMYELRTSASLTIDEVCAVLNHDLDGHSLGLWEAGGSTVFPPATLLLRLARVYNCNSGDFLEGVFVQIDAIVNER